MIYVITKSGWCCDNRFDEFHMVTSNRDALLNWVRMRLRDKSLDQYDCEAFDSMGCSEGMVNLNNWV